MIGNAGVSISLSSAVALESIPKLLLLSQYEQQQSIEQFADRTLWNT
jgi:hypothetical protein